MAIKYAVYNAVKGENYLHNSKEEALQAFWTNVVKFTKENSNNLIYIKKEIDEFGNEIWYDQNENLLDKRDFEVRVQNVMIANGSIDVTIIG